jgi:multiple sugar transport system substrate-binding protein
MPIDNEPIDRRELLKAAGVAGGAGLAGCVGGTGSLGGGGQSSYLKAAKSIGFGENWQKRRLTTLDEWKLEDRQATPDDNKLTEVKAWKQSQSLKSAPWKPPEGWKDTAAADVDSIQMLNFGDLKYDPATVATNAMFEERTGIKIEPLEIVVDQAIPKETAFLKAGQSKPETFNVVNTDSLSSFVQGEYLTNLDPLMPKSEMWNPYQPVAKNTMQYENHMYVGPTYLEGSLVHVRPDLLEEQGVPQKSVKAILDGTWTWDDLEAAMKAFEGTGTYAWAYRGSSRVYTMRDFLKMFYQAGGSFVQDDGTVKVNSKAGYTALRKMVEWREKGWVPNEVVSYGQGDLADGFLSGQFAMVPVFGDLVPKALKKYDKDKQYQPTLSPKGGEAAPKPTRAGIASPTSVAVNTNAGKGAKLAALLYLDANLSQPSQWWQFAVEGNQSYSKRVYEEAAKTGTVEYAKVRGKQVKINKAEIFPQERPIKQRVSQECQKAIAGDVSPKKALDNAQDFIDTVTGQ